MKILARTAEAVDHWAPVAVFAALPTLGLVAGPSYAGLVMGLSAVRMATALPRRPVFDRHVALTVTAFIIIGWISLLWSVAPDRTEAAALGLTGMGILLLPFVPGRPLAHEAAERLFRVMAAAVILGTAAAALDMALGTPVQAWITGRPGPDALTKYNRGLGYLAVVGFAPLAFVWIRRSWRLLVVLVITVVAVLGLGHSSTAKLAALIGIAVLAAAMVLPRVVAALLAIATVLVSVGSPVMIHIVAAHRAGLARLVKPSGLHRLEIWDYMTARIAERPLHGWGLSASTAVPIRVEELAGYSQVAPGGVYPHNQWLQLWVETGAPGAALGLTLALLVLHRAREMPERLRPWALGAFASAMSITCLNFEITTDSWWAALAATGFLFTLLSRMEGTADGRLPAHRG